ncbi:uncharacterized protein LOC144742654 [Ciona intestinalis]
MGTAPSKTSTHHAVATPVVALPKPSKSPHQVDVKDVMISYSHQDVDAMRKLKSMLEGSGLTVWVDEAALTPGSVFLREIGEAIVASRLFIVLLSGDSVQSKYCQDEVSLAYVSNKNIFAVSLLQYDDVTKVMDLGMKLTLSCVQWTFLNEDTENAMNALLGSLKLSLSKVEGGNKEENEEDSGQGESDADDATNVMNKQALNFRLHAKRSSDMLPVETVPDNLMAQEFWKLKFGDVSEVEWAVFADTMKTHMSSMWNSIHMSAKDVKDMLKLIGTEMDVENGMLSYINYIKFCKKGKEIVALDEAVQLFASATVAVKGVFNISSSVRLTAIKNLGDHQSKAVINVLLDLLYDEEQDVQVVAAISLAHAASGITRIKTRSTVVNGLLGCLSSNDRLVRESGCLALGRMKSKAAIAKLLHLWRNDTISSVREAAQIAIEQIGGEEAERAMHVTKVLSDEIQKLKKN